MHWGYWSSSCPDVFGNWTRTCGFLANLQQINLAGALNSENICSESLNCLKISYLIVNQRYSNCFLWWNFTSNFRYTANCNLNLGETKMPLTSAKIRETRFGSLKFSANILWEYSAVKNRFKKLSATDQRVILSIVVHPFMIFNQSINQSIKSTNSTLFIEDNTKQCIVLIILWPS